MKIFLSLLYAPLVLFGLHYFNTSLEDVLYLKAIPLLLASSVTLFMLLSYIQKKSIILHFAKKISQDEILEDEKAYIHTSTLFWILISSINILIHLNIYTANANDIFWTFYSSIGWYLLFICAGIVQYLHRRFVFLKRRTT